MESSIHALENNGKQLVPIRFTFPNKLSHIDKMLLAFDTLALPDKTQANIDMGRIIHGDDFTSSRIRIAPLLPPACKITGMVTPLLSHPDPPKFALNRHCPECEFQKRCHKLAIEKDDLSLLGSLPENERIRLNSKGIFSVTQLSYTFRPRRPSRRIAPKPEKYRPELKALSIREQKTHIANNPRLDIKGTPVFLDVEGIPDRDFYYLIGLRVQNRQHSLWAKNTADEEKIWRNFLDILSNIENPALVHYGSFETTFLKRMCERYGAPPENSVTAKALKSAVNLLSVIFAQIYFPTYSNSLKEIAKHLGFQWHDPESSGLLSLVWRQEWENSHNPELCRKLITYNADDCAALNLVTDTIRQYAENTQNPDIINADSLKGNPVDRLGTFKSTIADLEHINNAALWDYQRGRVYIRSGIKAPAPPRKPLKTDNRVDTTVIWKVSRECPKCGRKDGKKGRISSRTVHDLIYGRSSLKRRVVKYLFQTYQCRGCGHRYGVDQRFGHANRKYGWEVLSYLIYHIIGLCVSQSTVARSLNKILGFDLDRSNMNFMKIRAAAYYRETRDGILERILNGNLIHADETRANIRGRHAYVWVLTNMREVVYILAENREAELIRNLLADYKGVLVSDFYAAYDSIECPQQKCLIHIMRDLNDEIFKNPFNNELKKLAGMFTGLLKPIIATIDKYGLKKRFLKKHLRDVERFYKELDSSNLEGELALKYKQRFTKNRDKLFTFLLHDDVPWNNNNAEHAIKSFAMLRNIISGPSTKKGTEEYLTLLSVCKTCEYQGLDFLDFLRSGEKDIAGYASRKQFFAT